MKKYSILLLSLLTAAACTKESTQDIAPEFNQNGKLTVRGAFSEESTRITTEDGLGFALEANSEQIGVYVRNGDFDYTNIRFTAGDADEKGWVSFSSNEDGYKIYETSQIFAYAPYSATSISINGSTEGGAVEGEKTGQAVVNGKWDGKRAMNLPNVQEQAGANDFAHLAKYYAVVAAPATPAQEPTRNLDSYSVDLQFSGIFSLVRFVLENSQESDVTVSKLVLSGDAALTGDFNVDLTHNDPSLSNAAYAPEAIEGRTFGSVEVTLTTPAVLKSGEQTEIFAVVNAASVKTPKIEVFGSIDGKNVSFEKVFASDKTFTRNKRVALGVKLEKPIYEEDYAQEVIDALQKGGDVTIEKDVDLSSKAVVASNGALMIEIPEGTKVNLNIPAGVTVTLDKDAENIRIFNYGEITISGEGTIAGVNGVMRNYGTATVESGNFKTTGTTGGTALANEIGGTMIINDADVDAAYYALYNDYGDMTINNGTFNSNEYFALYNNDGTATINGGTFVSSSYYKPNADWAYCVKTSGADAKMEIHNATIIGIQGALTADNGSTLIVHDGTFATYGTVNGATGTNYYALYTANVGTATIYGGKFYREGSPYCIYTGNNDNPSLKNGIIYPKGGYFQDMGHDQFTKETIKAAEGYKWVELETPITETVEFYGTTYTNTYKYQIVEGVEDLGYKETETGYEIYNAAGLTWFAEQVNGGNNFSGKTIVLTDNIDLNNAEWTPIGTNGKTFSGTFDGNSKTISNLTVNRPEEDYNGLFGYVQNAELKNVTFSNVSINGRQYLGVLAGQAFSGVTMSGINVEHAEINGGHWIGGIVGHTYSNVLDCHVNDLNIVCTPYMVGSGYDNGDKVGGISGWMGSATIDKCSVTQATLKGYRDIGGITGLACKDGRDPVVTNNTVTDCIITADQTNYNYGDKPHNAGEIIGRLDTANITNENNTAQNVTIEIVGSVAEVTWAEFCASKGINTGYGTASDENLVIDGENKYVITDWVDAWYAKNLTVKNITFNRGATFTINEGINDEAQVLIENCTFHPCKRSELDPLYEANNNFRMDNSGDGLCLDIETRKNPNLTIIVRNNEMIGENDPTLPRDYLIAPYDQRLKSRGHAVAINAISGAEDGATAKSVEISGNTMTGIRGNAIQLYAFDYPIAVKNNTINSWGRNSATASGANQDAAIRGEILTTNGVAGTLTLENNYFGMDESASIFHVHVANYDGNTNTDHNRTAGTY